MGGAGISAFGQSLPLQCVANAATLSPIRSMDRTALTGEIVITCTGGTPAADPVPTFDFQIYFNTNYTGRLSGTATESLLLIDEPSPQNRVACTTDPSLCGWTSGNKGPNVYQGELQAPNVVLFRNIPFDPPGSVGVRSFRFTNFRVDASAIGLSSTQIPNSINAFIAASGGPHGLAIGNPQLTVGYINKGIETAVLNSTADTAVPQLGGVELQNCVTATKQRFATLRFRELLGTAGEPRTKAAFVDTETSPAPAAQAEIGWLYNSESGLYDPGLPSTNNLDKAGLADFGTRLQALFSNVPAGVTLYVPTVAVHFVNGVPAVNSGTQMQARLVSSATGPFAPVPATEVLDGIPAAALPLTQGGATAVWEVLQANPGAMEDLNFPVWISYPGNTVGLGTASVWLQYGPVSSVDTASETEPLPRFANQFDNYQLVTVRNMCPGSSYVVTTNPAGLSVEVDGQAYVAPHSFAWQSKSTHTIAVTSPQFSAAGTRHAFLGWSDAGAASHTITLPEFPTTYVAGFDTQHQLTLTASPGAGGTLTASPASADGFYAANSQVTVSAAPSAQYVFSGFTAPVNTTTNPLTVVMANPVNVVGSFQSAGSSTGVIGVSPNSGTGSAQVFTALFQGAQGAQSLAWAQMLVATSPDGGGAPFCFLHYDAHAGAFWVYSDQDGFFYGPVAAHTASGALQGTACALDTLHSAASGTGSQLSVQFRVLFKTAGARKVYLRASDDLGADTGWVESGTWTMSALPAPAMTVTPASGNGSSQTFQAKFASDAYGNEGSTPLGWQQFLIATDPSGGGQPFCFVHYDRAGGGLWMYSSDVGFFLGPVAPGTASTALDSSACSVDTAAAAASIGGDFSSTLSLPLTLKAPMSGTKNVYLRTLDALMRDSGWQAVGTYQVP